MVNYYDAEIFQTDLSTDIASATSANAKYADKGEITGFSSFEEIAF